MFRGFLDDFYEECGISRNGTIQSLKAILTPTR